MDIVYIGIGALGFFVAWGLAHLCEVLLRADWRERP